MPVPAKSLAQNYNFYTFEKKKIINLSKKVTKLEFVHQKFVLLRFKNHNL